MNTSRLSACTYPMRDRDIPAALGVIAASGLHKADLWGRMPHFSDNPEEWDIPGLLAVAAESGVHIANLGTYPGRHFAAADETVREAEYVYLTRVLEAASVIGVRSIRVMPGEGEDPAMIPQIAPYFSRGAEIAAELGICMGMENHGGSIAGSPKAALQLCEAVGSPYFGVLYEPCNLMHKGECYKRAFEVFSGHIVHVHVKDGRMTADGWQRTHLGEGEIDYAWVVAMMESSGYTGDYALEYEICDIEPIETGLPKWVERFPAPA